MPLYEYECEACGKRFELIQKFSDPSENTCVVCGGKAHRLLSAPAIQFKGSGWYVTDYGRGNAGPGSGKAEPTEKSDAKSDSKPAAAGKPGETTPAKKEEKAAAPAKSSG